MNSSDDDSHVEGNDLFSLTQSSKSFRFSNSFASDYLSVRDIFANVVNIDIIPVGV